MEPFRFRTAAQVAEQAATATEALADALDPTHDSEVRALLLSGVAGRGDLTREHVDTILDHLPQRCATLLVTLLANPVVSHDEDLYDLVARGMGKDDIFAFSLTPHAERLLPRMLAKCYESGNEDIHLAHLQATFTPTQIEAALHTLVDMWQTALYAPMGHRPPGGHTLALSVLGSVHFDRLVGALEAVMMGAVTPLSSGRSRRRGADFEVHTHQMALVEDIVATVLARTDLAAHHNLAFVQLGEKCLADTLAYTPPTQRDWRRAHATRRMLGNAHLCPEATAYAFTSTIFHISLKDIALTRAGIDAALLATAEHPHPVLVQRALNAGSTRSPRALGALIESVRRLDATRAAADLARIDTPDTSNTRSSNTWGRREHGHWWGVDYGATRDDKILTGLIHAGLSHIGEPVWDDIYAFALAQPNQAASSHKIAVNYFAGLVRTAVINYADDTATPDIHEFAVWASASDDALPARAGRARVLDPHPTPRRRIRPLPTGTPRRARPPHVHRRRRTRRSSRRRP